jgi:hypothetical protein
MRKPANFAAAAVAAAFLIFGIVDVSAQTKKRPVLRKKVSIVKKAPVAPSLYTVSTGKSIRVRMNGSISSRTAKVGDRFTVTVREPVYSGTGVVLVPEGSEIVGRVDSVVPARKGGKPGTLEVSFVQLVLPNGTKRAINGSLTDLHSDDAKSDGEGMASGDRMKNRKIIFIGGGGAGGAIIGAAIGGGKGALIGGLLGAGGGFLGEKFTKGEEAKVISGTEFGVNISRAFTLPRYREADPRP